MKKILRMIFLALTISLIALPELAAQMDGLDLNDYYRFPLSLGLQYKAMTPLEEYRSDYDLLDLSAVFRLPLPPIPVIQATIEGGLLQFAAREAVNSRWGHRDVYGLIGAAWSSRLTKNYELGAQVSMGASLSDYPSFMPGSGASYSQPNVLAEISAMVQLVPSFNFAIEISPSIRYSRALGPLPDFDGFIFGISVAGHIRLGEDPDAPKAALRSLQLEVSAFPPVFPAMQNWYSRNSLATVHIQNVERFPIQDIELSFYQKGFMDTPTLCAKLLSLAPGEIAELPVLAAFNQEVFRNEGITPLSGELVITYRGKGRAGEQRTSVSYDLQDKSAITWDDDRKIAAFITPADSALRNYASYIRQAGKVQGLAGYNDAVQFAAQLFHALAELGILYQVDPSQPFQAVSGNALTIDSVNLPRDTMRRITGDCDDLTALYAAIIESAGIPSAFITVSGHIYAAFNTKVAPKDFADIHADRGMTITLGNELWVPVEITMIGTSTFNEAWRKGAEQWNALSNRPLDRHFYKTAEAQVLFKPIGLRETDLGLQYGRSEPIVTNSLQDLNLILDGIVEQARAAARQSGRKEDWNRFGIKIARLGRHDQALEAFKMAAAMDPAYLGPRINTGNVLFLAGKYDKALEEFKTLESLPALSSDTRNLALLRINISKCFRALGDGAKAGEYLALATSLDSSLGATYAYLASPDSGARASEVVDEARDLVFAE